MSFEKHQKAQLLMKGKNSCLIKQNTLITDSIKLVEVELNMNSVISTTRQGHDIYLHYDTIM